MTSHGHGDGGEKLAPVTFLPGVLPPVESEPAPQQREAPRRAASLPDGPRRPVAFTEDYWAEDDASGDTSAAFADDVLSGDDVSGEPQVPDRESIAASAADALTRDLGRRGLSVAEANARLRADGLTDAEAAGVVQGFVERGWLDDGVLAEQLVYAATTRKDMGTRAVRQLLVKRLVSREVIDAVIAELPDDDAERALEFARAKARALTRYDDATATRRLMGMLARRGFGGSAAGQAARAALAEARGSSGASGVRFR
ncbi:regulatory protein RecX [Micromonospora sp. DT81.3]|uniref:regulatory protein RecX n=1 Tax=Micromonospora sp. DT81.3 TaxID=3416523 RepID=UPI003CF6E9AE